MKVLIIILLVLSLSGLAFAEDKKYTTDGPVITSPNALTLFSIDIGIVKATYFSFQCGNGYASISLKTGNVDYGNCSPDEASKAFWEALKPTLEQIKKEICNE